MSERLLSVRPHRAACGWAVRRTACGGSPKLRRNARRIRSRSPKPAPLTTMERAFHLARSGRFTTLTDVVTTLDREGYSANQIQGSLLKRQLTVLIKACASGAARQRPLARRPGQLSNGRPVSWGDYVSRNDRASPPRIVSVAQPFLSLLHREFDDSPATVKM
jgi:hypothetical protein